MVVVVDIMMMVLLISSQFVDVLQAILVRSLRDMSSSTGSVLYYVVVIAEFLSCIV
jgi:hypothetical protein